VTVAIVMLRAEEELAEAGSSVPVILSAMRCAVFAFALVALAACGGGEQDSGRPADRPLSELGAAAARGDVDSVRRLLAEGALVDTRDGNGRTAVTAAALGDHVDVARVLIDAGADVDLQDAERNNPLLVCGETGNVAMLREVLRARPDLRRTNRFGDGGPAHQRIVELLVDADADVDLADRDGDTALQHARRRGYQEIALTLKAAGAS